MNEHTSWDSTGAEGVAARREGKEKEKDQNTQRP